MSQSTDAPLSEPASAAEADFLVGFISEEDYARRRGVTIRTCQRDRQLRKSPPFVQVGRRIYYRLDAVRQWLLSLEQDNNPVPSTLRARSVPAQKDQGTAQRSRTRETRAPSTPA